MPRRLLSERQVGMLMALKEAVPSFAAIRHLAIHFQSLLRHHNEMKLDQWLDEAKQCGIPAVANFARTLMIDILAVRGDRALEQWTD